MHRTSVRLSFLMLLLVTIHSCKSPTKSRQHTEAAAVKVRKSGSAAKVVKSGRTRIIRSPGAAAPARAYGRIFGGSQTIKIAGKKIRFSRINPGTFSMGSPRLEKGRGSDETPHTVIIDRPFLMQTTEVTQALWRAVIGKLPQGCRLSTKKGPHPVACVSWDNAQEFITALNAQSKGPIFRLATEAEWEYAARCGSTGPYWSDNVSVGFHSLQTAKIARFETNSQGRTGEVGKLKRNACNLYDVHGNVWEWVEDFYGTYRAEPKIDPRGPPTGQFRVYRGCSFRGEASSCRSAKRNFGRPNYKSPTLGFRIVREVE